MDDKIYTTKDLSVASVLSSLEIQPDKVNYEFDGKRNIGFFIYTKNIKKINKIVEDYFNQSLKIEPNKLFYAMKSLKTRLYSVIDK
jgi:hypothetical protein